MKVSSVARKQIPSENEILKKIDQQFFETRKNQFKDYNLSDIKKNFYSCETETFNLPKVIKNIKLNDFNQGDQVSFHVFREGELVDIKGISNLGKNKAFYLFSSSCEKRSNFFFRDVLTFNPIVMDVKKMELPSFQKLLTEDTVICFKENVPFLKSLPEDFQKIGNPCNFFDTTSSDLKRESLKPPVYVKGMKGVSDYVHKDHEKRIIIVAIKK